MLDPYASCSCGSGKKFKWCCQAIYPGINKAFEQEEQGQHDTALRLMQEVVAEHGGNPEAWGQLARLQHMHGKGEEAEQTLEKAFAINPNYPFGLLLRAIFRLQEGEMGGALLLARKAAEAYSPDAKTYLAEVYSIILDCEMKRNRPIAARAAARILTHCRPDESELRAEVDRLFGAESRLPACARRDYNFLPPPDRSGPRRAAWDQALGGAVLPRFGDLARAFEKLTEQDAGDGAAWHNLALARAWLGENEKALDAIEKYLPLEADENRAETAAAMAEVLRAGAGLEERGDYCEYNFLHQARDLQPLLPLLKEWQESSRLLALPVDEQSRALFAMILDFGTSLITAGDSGPRVGKLMGYLLVSGPLIRAWGPSKEGVEKLRDEMRSRMALALTEMAIARGPILFQDVPLEAMIVPVREGAEAAQQRMREHVRRHFEEKWIHQPRQALSGNTPLDAAGHPTLRKKLRGVIRFLADCSIGGMIGEYDFNQLRHKLGLPLDESSPKAAAPAAPAAEAAPAAPAAPQLDIAAMNAADLGGIAHDSLTDDQLELAWQTAQRLDATDLASHFARSLVARPPQAGKADRYNLVSHLVQHALADGRRDEALDLINEGMRIDCEHNEGKRRNDYELRRGQVHVKRGEPDEAAEVFQKLIERAPAVLRYRTSATESMLALRQGARALQFAEPALAAARQQQDRDAEEHLLELIAAAKKQIG